MSKILKINQDYLPEHIVEVAHLFDDKLDSVSSNLIDTTITANSALSTALEATTNATQALNEAVTAQATAQNAVDRLAGDGDYFIGYWTLPNVAETNNAPASMVSALNQGITWDNTAKKFNFSYLGWYMLVIETSGGMNNTRTDGYQEFKIWVKQNGAIVQSNDLNIPNNMIKNIRTHFAALIKVGLGDSIQVYTKHNSGGTLLSSPTGFIRIKKVV